MLLAKRRILKNVNHAARHPGRTFADIYEGNAGYSPPVYATQHPFIVLKAGESIGHIDTKHATRADEAHKVGLSVGHYWYIRSEHSPIVTADLAWRTMHAHWMEKDFILFDWENPPYKEKWLSEYEKRIYKHSGLWGIGYAPLEVLLQGLLQCHSGKWWVPAYPGPVPNKLGHGQRTWAHQFTDRGTTKGVIERCDLSVIVDIASVRYWTK